MYRPERTLKKPRISGMESAVVVGPDSESEIHTDNFRRVKVQFRWDRVGTYDTGSSCYLRVMQAWAGHGFGVDFLPRVGMEVVVSYLGGDPDRPFITGCLYNQTAHPPYTSEADKTKSTIRTRTSPDDNGKFNELRFDDKKDGEEIFIHASRDFNEVVERNHTTRVKSNQSNTVNGNQTETVDHVQRLTVKEDRYQTVEGSEELVVLNSRRTRVDIDETVKIKGNASTAIKGTEARTTKLDRTVELLANDTEHVVQNKTVNHAAWQSRPQGIYLKIVCASRQILPHELPSSPGWLDAIRETNNCSGRLHRRSQSDRHLHCRRRRSARRRFVAPTENQPQALCRFVVDHDRDGTFTSMDDS
jgi:type VI secretion system secreted protein VgrG